MKFERNKNSKKYFLCGLILVVVLTITVTFITSKANYRMTASIPLTEGKVVSSPYDINVMAMYINDGDGNYQELSKETTIPIGYTINSENTYCCKGSNCKKENKDTNAILETVGGIHIFRGISKNDKCFIYLDKETTTAKTMSELLVTHYIGRHTRTSENKDFNVPFTETTMGVIYETEDDDGTSYYFAGNPLDNWVEFGGYYWRIIRINGDGSIRLIYQGRTEDEIGKKLAPQTTGEETQIGTSAFNDEVTDNKFVGYWYEQDVVHGFNIPSTIYGVVNDWYNKHISGKNFERYIDRNAGFCNDRTSYVGNYVGATSGGGISKTNTYYGGYLRIFPEARSVTITTPTISPSFKCSDKSNDLFTTKAKGSLIASNQGNNVLENPIGLITADELSYAGVVFNADCLAKPNFMLTGQPYFTITPSYYVTAYNSRMFVMSSTGFIGLNLTNKIYGVRPVINLRSDVTFTGDGTISNPYKVVV
ncbi:MAG: hypothetical protein NC483_07255 [Ruminococcus sp.]|nr:hypothetical protein [Ruminococcus sp.]